MKCHLCSNEATTQDRSPYTGKKRQDLCENCRDFVWLVETNQEKVKQVQQYLLNELTRNTWGKQ